MKQSLVYHVALLAWASLAVSSPISRRDVFGHNDFSCQSLNHPNPVILLHGLGANEYEDLNVLEAYLQTQEFCTFGITYGAYDAFPFFGGLKAIADSAQEIAQFILQVRSETGADKVDLVGHSEGGFQALYVPKFEPGVAGIVDKIVSIAPPTHGTTFANLADLAYLGGNASRDAVGEILQTFGCPACDDLLVGGDAVARLDDGPIAQPGNNVLVLASKSDELVTPTSTSFIHEDGVTNVWTQDKCPLEILGHIGLAYDLDVWWTVQNWLDPAFQVPALCVPGLPF
ncbi:uncharacterized protein Z518_11183 [Rhinocladiella mackenziei CBS 650.93]|uniref:Uncharacterized protein n=1 Tax=Rhinocladiella mackenziei CBS 650.93 TaxID=1442369 RepID=A0A0D2IRU0_9EURO|nr:uncharacterized protein Z518_11183 [Rhinocladiella mackenziei CBS 650.93]KIW99444.1 hypothetical protein Z518_11183 [Rhinocladiella mackenziei CBS 650.93]